MEQPEASPVINSKGLLKNKKLLFFLGIALIVVLAVFQLTAEAGVFDPPPPTPQVMGQ